MWLASTGTGRRSVSRRLATGTVIIRDWRSLSPPAQTAVPADPALLSEIAVIGNNSNHLAQAANRQQWLDEIALLCRLIDIERSLRNLAAGCARISWPPELIS